MLQQLLKSDLFLAVAIITIPFIIWAAIYKWPVLLLVGLIAAAIYGASR